MDVSARGIKIGNDVIFTHHGQTLPGKVLGTIHGGRAAYIQTVSSPSHVLLVPTAQIKKNTRRTQLEDAVAGRMERMKRDGAPL